MDELLHDRVKQLREIDERIERVMDVIPWQSDPWLRLRSLRSDLAAMIQKAEVACGVLRREG